MIRVILNKWKLILKCTWVAVNLAILLFGLGTCLLEPTCWYAQNNFLPLMIWLSFPSGLLLFFFAGLIDVYTPIDYSLVSLGVFIVGYAQWFHVVPRLLGRPEITTLSLARTKQTAEHEQPPLQVSSKRQTSLQVQANRIVPFDNKGRTPLERVINDN
jgi:hypothetical protein